MGNKFIIRVFALKIVKKSEMLSFTDKVKM